MKDEKWILKYSRNIEGKRLPDEDRDNIKYIVARCAPAAATVQVLGVNLLLTPTCHESSARFGSARHGTEKTPLHILLRNRGSVFRCYSSCMA
jgi:hypothetical protein